MIGITPPPFGTEGKELHLYVLDIQDPTNPVEIARYVQPYAYPEVHTPGAPVVNDDDTLAVLLDGSWGCGRHGRLHVLDISDLDSIQRVSTVKVEESDICDPTSKRWPQTTDAVFKGNLVYTAWLAAGIRVIDVTDPANPVEVGKFLSPSAEIAVALEPGHVRRLCDRNDGVGPRTVHPHVTRLE